VRLMTNLYPTAYHPEMKLQYVDTDGDKCTITSELEWTEMKQEVLHQSVFRIWVSEGTGAYFKDGPAPELVTVYSDPINPTQPEPPADNWSSLHDRVSRSLSNLFPGGKILPLNLPAFLEGIVVLKPRDDNLVDLDVDISQLASVLGKRAFALLTNPSKADLHEAKACLISQLILYPTECIAFYNLACAEALLDNAPAALSALEKSIMNGYGDTRHMTTDPDLRSLYNLPKFLELVELAKVGTLQEVKDSPQPAYPQPEPALPEPVAELVQPAPYPEPVPEPVHEPVQEIVEEIIKPEPIVEIVPEELVQEPELEIEEPKKWGAELRVLADMGFLDESILVQTLDQTGGDVAQALTSLLG